MIFSAVFVLLLGVGALFYFNTPANHGMFTGKTTENNPLIMGSYFFAIFGIAFVTALFLMKGGSLKKENAEKKKFKWDNKYLGEALASIIIGSFIAYIIKLFRSVEMSYWVLFFITTAIAWVAVHFLSKKKG